MHLALPVRVQLHLAPADTWQLWQQQWWGAVLIYQVPLWVVSAFTENLRQSRRELLLATFERWRNGNSERWGNLPRITQLESGRTGIWSQVFQVQRSGLAPNHLAVLLPSFSAKIPHTYYGFSHLVHALPAACKDHTTGQSHPPHVHCYGKINDWVKRKGEVNIISSCLYIF